MYMQQACGLTISTSPGQLSCCLPADATAWGVVTRVNNRHSNNSWALAQPNCHTMPMQGSGSGCGVHYGCLVLLLCITWWAL